MTKIIKEDSLGTPWRSQQKPCAQQYDHLCIQ